jgi:hypothetical protein
MAMRLSPENSDCGPFACLGFLIRSVSGYQLRVFSKTLPESLEFSWRLLCVLCGLRVKLLFSRKVRQVRKEDGKRMSPKHQPWVRFRI